MKRFPLSLLMFQNMWKACKKVLEEFEDFTDVGFVQVEGGVQSCPVVLVEMKIEVIEVWNAVVHTLDHLVLILT